MMINQVHFISGKLLMDKECRSSHMTWKKRYPDEKSMDNTVGPSETASYKVSI